MKIRDSRKYFVVLYLTGFLIGIISTNLISRKMILYSGIFSESFINQYRQMQIEPGKYLWYVIVNRVFPVLLLGILGCMRRKKILVVIFLCWTGFLCGTGVTLSILKMGVKGMLLGIVSLTPHILFYIVGYFILLWYLYQYPKVQWNGAKTIGVGLSLAIGILLETWVNPVLMQWIVRSL